MPEVVLQKRDIRTVTMAKASLNSGQVIYAVNDLFIGPRTHSSARYLIRSGEACETQSSSGVIISTGMGSSGWLKSLLAGATAITQSASSILPRTTTEPLAARHNIKAGELTVPVTLQSEFAWDADHLFYTVREPFPTKTTGASLVFGLVTRNTPLVLESRMAENGVIFSDGIEKDFLEFNSGTQAVISIAERRGALVV
jgi:hypothetical protein